MTPGRDPGSYQAYDELRESSGLARPHWRRFLDSADVAPEGALAGRWRLAERLIRENGVTYNLHGDPAGFQRPWPLDPVPAILAAAEWRQLEAGLVQRGRLFNAILADLYGAQCLLKEGVLPMAPVFGNPGFLRPCHGIVPRHGRYLHLHAVDLARRPDGSWCVLADRTQAPSGAGYALENRMVVSRSLADAFRDCKVRRLSGFFRAFRDTLASSGPERPDATDPQVVLLTPGPYAETYFEHAYLARYLGYPLVSGEDLTVRDDVVYLKTLGGLQRVDVILRRLDDDFCDPLWLDPRSTLGIAGLVQAARRGNVTIANALGSGVVENPALMPYLPACARRLLDEDLLLPSVETHWCGDPAVPAMLGADPRAFVIKPITQGIGVEPVFGDRLDRTALARLLDMVASRPAAFVLQRRLPLSRVPVWRNDKIEGRPMVFRTYLAAAGADGAYVAMPGGLTRVSPHMDDQVVSIQHGGGSKDTWVLADGPIEHKSLWRAQLQPGELRRRPAPAIDLPSRAADDLFWLGRYAERSEATIRLLRAALARAVQGTDPLRAPAVPWLMDVLAARGLPAAPLTGVGSEPSRQTLRQLAVWIGPGGLDQILLAWHRVAINLRDRLSADTWRILSALGGDHGAAHPTGSYGAGRNALTATPGEMLGWLDDLLGRVAAFNGMAMENMVRGIGWRFMEIGRRLERAIQIAGTVQGLCCGKGRRPRPADEGPMLDALLEICDSTITYRSRYFTFLQPAAVLDLVIAEDGNPRALAFQLSALAEHARHLPSDRPASASGYRMAASVLDAVGRSDMERLAELDAGRRPMLDAFLMRVVQDLHDLSDALNRDYFNHAAGVVQRPVPRARRIAVVNG
jgi:uncharacterized circularly permuted ATP-grasp superfamily protein/uncharacterized alpha-E superfamily protein